MSTQVFPTFRGLEWNNTRSPKFNTIQQFSVSGKRTALALQPYPKRSWSCSFSYLGSGTLNNVSNTDMMTLEGFFNSRQGSYDTFLFSDPVDNTVTAQGIGTGDGSTKTFQLVRSFGGFSEPILAPNTVSHVYKNGVDGSDWSVSSWGSSTPGIVTFNTAPGSGVAITADFTFYFPVAFDNDSIEFTNIFNNAWELKKLSFTQVFN